MIVLFAKPPVAGQAKTRLGAALGDEAAAELARTFLVDTVQGLRGHPIVLATTDPAADHGVDLPRWDQGGGDLGARLERMLARALDEHPVAIAMGADSPGIPSEHVAALLDAPRRAAIGPAEDGGFWGLRIEQRVRLDGIVWSAPTTARATAERLRAQGVEVAWGPAWWDIDTVEDLRRFRREAPIARAPATHRALDRLGWP